MQPTFILYYFLFFLKITEINKTIPIDTKIVPDMIKNLIPFPPVIGNIYPLVFLTTTS